MISVEGFKAFHGDLIVKPVNGMEPFTMTGDWLYKPDCDCWYGGGQSFPADICEAVEVDRVAELETEVASREQSGIEEHNEVHYWRDRAKKAESELSALQSSHKEAMKLLEVTVRDLDIAGRELGRKNRGRARRRYAEYKMLNAKENGGATPHAGPIEAGTTGMDTAQDIEPIE